MKFLAEYIWIDGTAPTKQLRSKTKVISNSKMVSSTEWSPNEPIPMDWFPTWGADGSSTNQAEGADSDIILKPVNACADPFRKGNYLVLCEVYNADGSTPHSSNTRHDLVKVLEAGADKDEALFGFEQEYTLMKTNGEPLGFPENGFPAPQGPYYCAVGAGKIFGRDLYEEFMQRVMDANLSVSGFNLEVMPGQAEFQVGAVDGLTAGDHIWLARWIIHRVSEKYDAVVSLDAKPAKGDWNGAGMHVNFSTKEMREEGGAAAIEEACVALSKKIEYHLDRYGVGIEERLTGAHETCSYKEFKWGIADRTASVRIPRLVEITGTGYLEDRRPNACADPYEVATALLTTISKNL